MLRKARSRRRAHAIKITRRDGLVLRFTDHDRTITFEGETYEPIVMGELSAERREAAFRSGNQEARGFVDGSVITIPDLLGNLYRGAEVRDVIFDWARPWHVTVRHRKWIRNVTWTGSNWVGVLEGRTQVLQRPAGGRFGGTFSQQCLYKLGDPLTCKVEITTGTGLLATAGVRVLAVLDNRMRVEFDPLTLTTLRPDGFYRDGEIEWKWALAAATGLYTSVTTSTVLTDSTKTWTINEHVGRDVRILAVGAGGSVSSTRWARILSNTATTVTYATQANMAGHVPAPSGAYDICGATSNTGVISPIVYYTHGDREAEFLIPTPFPILVGDSGIIRAGCDGLVGTCKEKFDNLLNFGGDPFAPSANAIIEPPEAV